MTTLLAPAATSVSSPFWTALENGELLMPECADCRHRFFPPQPACPNCLGQNIHWKAVVGQAAVKAVTVVHQPPAPGLTVPFALALVELHEGWVLMTHVVGIDPQEVVIDMPVQLRIERSGPDHSGAPVPVFGPVS